MDLIKKNFFLNNSEDNYIIKNLHFSFLLLLPIAIVTGPFLSDLIITLSGIFLIYISIKEKKWNGINSIFFILFLLWCLYLIISSILSKNVILGLQVTFSLESSLFHFRFGFFALSLLFALKHYQNFLKSFSIIFIFVFIFVILDSFIQFYFGYDIFGNEADYLRISGPFGDELILGSYLSRLFPITFAFIILLLKDNNFFRHYIILFFLLTCMAILISNERVPIVNMILTTGLIIFCLKSVRLPIIISLIIFTFLTSVLFISNDKFQYSSRIELIEDRLIEVTRRNVFQYEDGAWYRPQNERSIERVRAFSDRHEAHYKSALKMFFDRPFFGVGTKNFRKLCQFNKFYVYEACSTHPHNTYIQLLSETGVFGFLPVIFLFLYVCYFLFKISFNNKIENKSTNNDFLKCMTIALLVTLWPLIPTGSFFNNWLNVIYFLPVGFVIFSIKRKVNI